MHTVRILAAFAHAITFKAFWYFTVQYFLLLHCKFSPNYTGVRASDAGKLTTFQVVVHVKERTALLIFL